MKMKMKAFWGLQAHWKSLDGLCKVFCLSQMPAAASHAKCWTKSAFFFGRWHSGCISKGAKFPGTLRQTPVSSFGKPTHLQDHLQSTKSQAESRHSLTSQQAGSNSQEVPMGLYRVRVATGTFWSAGTFDTIAITLVGVKGESPKQPLNNLGKDFTPGSVSEYEVPCDQELGPILIIRLHKEPYLFFPEDSWYCDYVQLETPQGETYRFPCYQWIEGYRTLELREGAGKLRCDDVDNALLLHRAEEVKARQDIYRWGEFVPGMPQCLAVESLEEIDTNMKFSLTKLGSFLLRSNLTRIEVKLKGLMNCQDSWKRLEDIRRVFWFNKTPASEYVADHWQEDAFFGYQYLNGVNPAVIKKCTDIPANFPVTQEMVASSLGESTTLKEEVQKGNIFILDYKLLEGIPTNTIQGQRQYIAAPLCLLYQTPAGDLLPIAIQLSQTPGPDSPIFLPSDPVWDWTLAKMWVRNADFHVHQNISHLLRTHLLAEIFALATLRQLPMCHPLFKLLIPHFRYTFQINALARVRLIKEGGMMDKATSAGYKGIVPIVGRGVQSMTYASLCLPEDIEARGVSMVANYYYRDDGMKLWAAIERFVTGIVKFYYKNDSRVQSDPELQAWIQEIFIEAFRSRKTSGAPSSLETTDELVKFLTMVIFTCSAQHAAVNSGQFDFGAWIPNIPPSMRRPPPKEKGKATLEGILETIPQVNTTCIALSSLWLLSNETGDRRPLGCYPDEHFTEDEPRQLITALQGELAKISEEISGRNKSLPLPYEYINPPNVENSVSI